MLAFVAPAMAQEAGGIALPPGITGPHGLARPLLSAPAPFQTAQSVQNGMTPADHQAANQAAISSLRGDAGFLAGFSFGTPQATSRQTSQSSAGGYGYDYRRRHHEQGQGATIINNTGPLALTVGNGNVVQQQGATGSGPTAQQQVVTMGGVALGGGAVNRVLASGNIVQSAPGSSR
jgi:hypothetical protein